MIMFCRIAALNHWKNRVGPDGTYRNLLRILALGEWHDGAKEVIAFINSEFNKVIYCEFAANKNKQVIISKAYFQV